MTDSEIGQSADGEGSQMSEELTKEEALAMLEFHSFIHNTETVGLSIACLGGGFAVGLKLGQIKIFAGGSQLFITPAGYAAAAVLIVLGVLLAGVGPRILLNHIQGGDD